MIMRAPFVGSGNPYMDKNAVGFFTVLDINIVKSCLITRVAGQVEVTISFVALHSEVRMSQVLKGCGDYAAHMSEASPGF